MTETARNRFEQPEVWGSLKDDPVITRKAGIIAGTIPVGVVTILDVGCGDGAITNRLGGRYHVTGIDSSEEALRHLETDAVHGDATALPFGDRSFDLVLSSEMLEHLDDDSYRRATAEICRVASRFVLITVPYREDLRFRTIRCPRCGWRGHVWGHRRRFNAESLLADLPGFRAVEIRIFGTPQPPPWHRLSMWPVHNVLRSFYWAPGQHPMCERCGNTEFAATRPIHPLLIRVKQRLDRRARRPELPFWLAVLAERGP